MEMHSGKRLGSQMCQVYQGEQASGWPPCRRGLQEDVLPLHCTSLPSWQPSCQMLPGSSLLNHNTTNTIKGGGRSQALGILPSNQPYESQIQIKKLDIQM